MPDKKIVEKNLLKNLLRQENCRKNLLKNLLRQENCRKKFTKKFT